jgi:poly-gamma-glutamate synthesis protein (capsule biosynthesis protein)
VGDLTLASERRKSYAGSFNEYYDLYGPGYFCENVLPVFENSDCVVANLECALTDNQDPAIRQTKEYNYKGYTEYTSIITASNIDVVNLANNHSYDYSQEGYDDTVNALENAGIDYFGNGTVLIKEINGINVGFIGVIGTGGTGTVKNGLDYLKQQGAEIKIVSFHWGVMDERVASGSQVSAAHYAIDSGADLVIGHHPHVLQGIELYKGRYIAYSIGNFIFDGNVISDIENRTSIILQQRFSLYGTEIVDVSINIIPILVTSGSGRNNFKPVIATGEQKENILNKIEARSSHYPNRQSFEE